jgi:formylglycine-generating enzyme required for sulfatase activity
MIIVPLRAPATKSPRLAAVVTCAAALVGGTVLWLSWDRLWPRYLLWRDFQQLERNPQGYLEYLHEPSGIVFVMLPGGEYLMGTEEEEQQAILKSELANAQLERALSSEGPLHRVVLSAFLIAKYEVTESQWKRIMADDGKISGPEDLPKGGVSWYECQKFCRRASLDLPTEAQWEYACRGGITGPFAGTGRLGDMGWHGDDAGGEHEVGHRAHAGGGKMPNAFGLFDMHGNMEEWCEDSLDENFYSSPQGVVADPLCIKPSRHRIARGGSFQVVGRCCRSGRRGWLEPESKWNYLGLRPVLRLRAGGSSGN